MSGVADVFGFRKGSWLERLLDALVDPARRERAVVALLAGYAAVWSLYGAVAKSSQDINFDMGEMVVWSREVTFGTPKHPPLPAWLVRAWFGVFPLEDWAYYLFAILLATLALWVAWKVSARYLDGEKRVIGLALLTLVPFYNFHALKFNANTAMLPLWALATWAFLRSYETRRPLPAALAGLAAAAAMLGKYWSIFLLLGFGLAALADPRRRTYFGSSAPWLTVAAGAVGIAPHVVWLYANDFKPFDYAIESHHADVWGALLSGLGYLAGAAGYLAVPTLIASASLRPSRPAIVDTLLPADADRCLALNAFLLPFVLPIAGALAAREEVVSLWSMGSMTLFPIVLLSSPLVRSERAAARRILAFALAVPITAALLSPVIAMVIQRRGVPNHATHYRLLAQAVDDLWRQATDRPLRVVGSYNNLLNGTVFYLPGQPSTFDITSPVLTPWSDEARVARDGIAMFCPADMVICTNAMNERAAHAPPGKRAEVELSRRYLGFADPPARYLIVTIPPQDK